MAFSSIGETPSPAASTSCKQLLQEEWAVPEMGTFSFEFQARTTLYIRTVAVFVGVQSGIYGGDSQHSVAMPTSLTRSKHPSYLLVYIYKYVSPYRFSSVAPALCMFQVLQVKNVKALPHLGQVTIYLFTGLSV